MYSNGGSSGSNLVDEISCNQGKWFDGSVQVLKAACITGFSCAKKSKLSSDCGPLTTHDAPGCAQVTNFADDSPKKCTAGDLYYQKTVGTDYVKVPGGKLSCNKETGEWEDIPTSSYGTGSVVCGTDIPVVKKQCQAGSTPNPLKSDCTSITDCKELPPISDASTFTSTSCTTPGYPNLYVHHNVWKVATSVACYPRTGFWMDGTQLKLNPNDNIVCSALDLTVKECLRCKELTQIDCGTDCIPGSAITHATEGSPAPCKKEKCTGNDFFALKYSSGLRSTNNLQEISCDASTSKWMDGANEIVGGVCIKGYSCMSKNPISTDCTGLDSYRCEPIVNGLTNDASMGCTQPNKKLFIKTSTTGTDVWSVHTSLECDKNLGEWKVDNTITSSVANAICAESNPGETTLELTCQGTNNLKSDCDGIATDCDLIPMIADDSPPSCAPPKNLYVSVSGVWSAVTSSIECVRTTGEWTEDAASTNPRPLRNNDKVVCANALPEACSATPHDAPSCDISADCEQVPLGDSPTCPSAKKLYFLKDQSTKWMEAISIRCVGATWQIEYNFGIISNKKEEFAVVKVACATKNPTLDGCSVGKFIFPLFATYDLEQQNPTVRFVEAGHTGTCNDESKYDKLFAVDLPPASAEATNVFPLSKDSGYSPVCRPDGQWELQHLTNTDPEMAKTKGTLFVCRVRKCQICPDIPKIDTTLWFGGDTTIHVDSTGECKIQTCRTDSKFIVNIGEAKTMHYVGQITCNDNHEYIIDTGDIVTSAGCLQNAVCNDINSLMIKTNDPAGLEGYEKLNMPTEAPSAAYDKLKCTTSAKKILIKKDDEDVWDDVKDINCDENTAKWRVELLNAEIEQRDYKNTIVCADSNPNPRPTTTMTPPTTTPKPELICDLCERYLPNVTEGGEWDKNGTIIKAKNDNVCVLKPKTGTTLIIHDGNKDRSFNEEVQDGLECKRPEEGSGQNPVWKTSTGAIAKEISARRYTEPRTWKYEYIIVVVALLFIGGMAIGCVLIYCRMRKQPSSREKKKKERGVTKKYTSAGVVRTGGRSSGGSREAAKSTDPTKSKMEDNEDAPTLKL